MKDQAELFVDCRCDLGEGPFWHSELRRIFWFDINAGMLTSADAHGKIMDRFTFGEPVSAASVIDRQTLAVVSASALLRFDMTTQTSTVIVPIEEDKPANRSNDSRVNAAGGFWIGTMDRAERGPFGALYQYRSGKLETLLDNVAIPNSICFSPDGRTGYFSDTTTGKIMKTRIDPATGLPRGEWSLFVDTGPHHRGHPDGSVVDSEGYLWNARYGGSCVVRHATDGSIDRIVELPVSQVTCPAFGGDDLKTLYITSAKQNMKPEQIEAEPTAGSVYSIRVDVPGLPDPMLKL